MAGRTPKPPPKPKDKAILRQKCGQFYDDGTEDRALCDDWAEVTWLIKVVDEHYEDTGRRLRKYACEKHVPEQIWQSGRDCQVERIRFSSKDAMRNHARRMTRDGELTSMRSYLYKELIDMMWTGEDGTETSGHVMNRFATVNALHRNTGMDRATIAKHLVWLDDEARLINVYWRDTKRDEISQIHMIYYQAQLAE